MMGTCVNSWRPGSKSVRATRLVSLSLLVLATLATAPAVRTAYADDVARMSGGIKTTNANADFKGGPGAVCARTEVTESSDPPGATGKGCNNMTMIGKPKGPLQPVSTLEPIIGIRSTAENGDFANRVFPKRYSAGLMGGQALRFNESDDPDKLPLFFPNTTTLSQLAISPSNFRPLVSAVATQTVTRGNLIAVPPTTDQVTWSATAAVLGIRPALAIAIVNDPMDVGLIDSSQSGSALLTLGNEGDLMSLSVGGPGEFAAALFEFGVGTPESSIGLTVVSFLVDDATESLADAIDVLQFDASSGFANAAALEAFLESPTNNFFSFDALTHTLTENREVPLMTVALAPGSSAVRVVYNAEAIAGAVPEPATLSLTLFGLFVLAFLAWLRDDYGRSWPRAALGCGLPTR